MRWKRPGRAHHIRRNWSNSVHPSLSSSVRNCHPTGRRKVLNPLFEMLHLIGTILSWMKSRIEQGLLITFFVLRQRFCSRTSLAMIASSGAMYRRSDPNLFLTPSILHPKANPAMFRPTLQPRKWEAWASSHNNLRPQLRLQLLGLRRYTEIGVG